MRPNEVRFKNLVKYKGKVYKIAAITEEYPYLNTTEFGDGVVEWGDLEGIELNEEWLINLGFEITYSSNFRLKFDHNNRYEFGFDFSHTADKSMEGFRYYGKYIKAEYVHELQNLFFALTNQELTINEDSI